MTSRFCAVAEVSVAEICVMQIHATASFMPALPESFAPQTAGPQRWAIFKKSYFCLLSLFSFFSFLFSLSNLENKHIDGSATGDIVSNIWDNSGITEIRINTLGNNKIFRMKRPHSRNIVSLRPNYTTEILNFEQNYWNFVDGKLLVGRNKHCVDLIYIHTLRKYQRTF